MTLITKTADAIAFLTSVIARLMLIGVAAMLVVQVALRFGFSYSLPWPEEASRYMMIWVVMLAGSLLVKDNQLVRVDFLDYLWPESWLVYRNAIIRIVMAGLFVTLAYQGFEQAMFSSNRTTTALQVSWFWPYLAVPVGAVLILFQMFALTLRELARGRPESESLVVEEPSGAK